MLELARAQPVVVKASSGPGRGAGVLVGSRGDLPATATPRVAAPYVVQPYLSNDGSDHKLYVIRDHVWGLRKPSPLVGGHQRGGAAFDPDEELREIARQVGRTVGVELYGVDVLRTPSGPGWSTATTSRATAVCRVPPASSPPTCWSGPH